LNPMMPKMMIIMDITTASTGLLILMLDRPAIVLMF
jgi:hypothetical protein